MKFSNFHNRIFGKICNIILNYNQSFHFKNSVFLSAEENVNFEMTLKSLRKTKSCVLREIIHASAAVWPRLHQIVNNCSFIHRTNTKRFIPFTSDKLFIPFTKSPTKCTCNVVSLGVGGEVEMEKQLKKLYPFCKFYGADPFQQTAEAYNKVGTVYITAVDDVSGQRVLSTLNGTVTLYTQQLSKIFI